MYYNLAYFDENNEPKEVQLICNICGKIIVEKDMSKFKIVQSDYCVLCDDKNILCECGNAGNGFIEYKKNPSLKSIQLKNTIKDNTPKCPTCGSTNVRPISATKRVVGTLTFGLANGTVGKSYECLNCKYKW